MKQQTKTSKNPWVWIPTLYFAEGIPYVIVMTVSVIMYKRFGLSNTDIALYTSWLYLPWVIKPFWSPFVDILKTKRWWIVLMQLFIGAGLAGIALTLPTPFYFKASLAFFWLLAFSSATHDIAADGFYMLALDDSQQSFFVGIRSTFYRLAMITGQGLLIILAGALEIMTGSDPMYVNVTTSPTEQVDYNFENIPEDLSNIDELTFVVYPKNVTINTNKISTDSLSSLKEFAREHNTKNGFIALSETEKLKKNRLDGGETWWSHNISTPLANAIVKNFGVKKEVITKTTDDKVGNAKLVAVRLNKQPEEDKEIVLNTGFAKGDKSISIGSGERLVFNSMNWNVPAYILVQLDPKLEGVTSASFKGISGNIPLAWSITFFIMAGFFILIFVYHRFVLPRPASDHGSAANSPSDILHEFGITFVSFFKKRGIFIAILFMLLYRLGEALLVKLSSPFLLDIKEFGGLGLTTGEVGFVYGTVGVISLTVGGILGGIAVNKKGLKYWLWPMVLAITLPNLAYLYLSTYMPESMILINTAVALEQFGYGFGFTAYMMYMIYFSEGKHKTAHYAICTGFMALGMMLPGMVAGWIQELIGYQHFFILVILCAIPTFLVIPFLKVDPDFGKKDK
ncbi:PAT family beta-lactamase induction signal transducer AmpG [Balneicella halophila]|uniref:PAT family beta-lactamase induction signal transducer AmpG n=1 Tax=Balneicella halophila TaxID=1537566 RepID=A0A7L4UPF5_BALHA|nr:PAT family beta-lactamase induction signal transducer AmpG [Balneicella halophila]